MEAHCRTNASWSSNRDMQSVLLFFKIYSLSCYVNFVTYLLHLTLTSCHCFSQNKSSIVKKNDGEADNAGIWYHSLCLK